MTGRLLRSFVPVGVAAALLVAAGCGDDSEGDTDADSAAPLPTHTIAAQSYTQKAPVQAESENGDISDVEPGEVVDVEQEYTVEQGDYMTQIASMFEVSAEEVANYNRFDDGVNHELHPGDTIMIPPGAVRPVGQSTTTTTQPLAGQDVVEDTGDGDGDGASEDAATEGAGDNCGEGTYTLEPNDYPIGVANKFDVTLDALNAANEGTSGYSGFYPGLEIVIPAKSDC